MLGMLAADETLKAQFRFVSGLRFELFYALRLVTDASSRAHAGWKATTRAALPAGFHRHIEEIGGAPDIWTLCADALSEPRVDLPFEEIVRDLQDQAPVDFQRRILIGAIHFPDIVEKLIGGKMDLRTAIAASPAQKREWFAWIGLFPYDAGSPLVIGLEKLLASPDDFRRSVIGALQIFWERAFKSVWNASQGELLRSLREKERLFDSCTFSEFAQMALLRVAVDYERETVTAIRGGYEIPFSDIEAGYIIPSMFNDRRYWTVHPDNEGIVYLPYFDPALSPEETPAGDATAIEPDIDPILLFKALGDTTRFALARHIARRPMTATELAGALSVSKPTISHHLTLLREAGLIHEASAQGSISLTLRREMIEQLSHLGLTHLFGE